VDGRPIDIAQTTPDYTFLRESSGAHACVVKTGWKTEGVIMNIECEESFTPPDVYS